MMRELLFEVKGMRKEQQEFREEINQLKKQNRRLNEIVVTLENRITVTEREDRKNNILIKGLDVASGEQLQFQDVGVFIESKPKTKALQSEK